MTDHDKDNWPKADINANGVLLIATLAILIIMGAYAYVRHLIGAPL